MSHEPMRHSSLRFTEGRSLTGAFLLLYLLCWLLPAGADRVLVFRAAAARVNDHYAGEVWGGNEVVVRLRSAAEADALRRAGEVADRLTALAIDGLRAEELSLSEQGGASLMARGQTVVAADAFTITASRLSGRGLCESWRTRLAAVLREPYICLERSGEVLVPYGETRRIRFGGTVTGRPAVESLGTEIAQAELSGPGSLLVRGAGVGKTAVSLAVGGLRHLLVIEVRKWAARIPAQSVARMRGSLAGDELGRVAVVNAAMAGVVAEPGARVELLSLEPDGAGYRARVTARGLGLLTNTQEVAVSLAGGLAPMPQAARLFVSNYPEKVGGEQTLLRQRLQPGTATRVYWHHVNTSAEPLDFAVRVLNSGPREATVRAAWAQSGPGVDEVFVGFRALERFWELVAADGLVQMRVPAGAACRTAVLTVGCRQIVSGVMHLLADEGEGLFAEVVAQRAAGTEPMVSPFSEIRLGEMTLSSYDFAADLDLAMSYQVGGPFAHATIGRDAVTNDDGFRLDGAYGVMHSVTIEAANPTDRRAKVEILARAGGGVCRVLARIDGTLCRTGMLGAGQEEVLAAYWLEPGQQRTNRMQLIPAAGSNLPHTLIVRSLLRN